MKIRPISTVLYAIVVVFYLSIFAAAQKQPTGTAVWEINDRILNCEMELLTQDAVLSKALELQGGGILIVVIRPGTRETSAELTRRRLFNVKKYFSDRGKELPTSKVLFTIGEPVIGYGRVQYYLDGKLLQQLVFPTNGYICHSCCGPDADYYPEKGNYNRNKVKGIRSSR